MASQVRERPDRPATGVAASGLSLVNKVRTDSDIAMRATKLNAAGAPRQVRVPLTNLQAMYERGTATSDQSVAAEAAGTRVPGLGATAGARTAHGWRSWDRDCQWASGPGRNRHVGWQEQ
jgi:hypothetical protein